MILFVSVLLLAVIVYTQYPKLNLIAGYTAKNMCSNVFIANRSANAINTIDHNLPLIKLAKTTVDYKNKTATSSVFGIMKRTAVYREGLGAVLINDTFDTTKKQLTPNRTFLENNLEFPYGNLPQKDTRFEYIDYKKLEKAVTNAFAENIPNETKHTRSLLIIHKDKIIAEKYAKGFDKDTKLLGWSMTKNILATLFGILEKEKGFDIHSKVCDVTNFTNWKNDERSEITSNHLLNMTSGLQWDEDYSKISDVTKMLFLEKDMTLSQAQKKATHKAGNFFNYSSGTTNLLSGIVKAQFSNHQEYLDFPYKTLIDKIGMNSMILETDMTGNYAGSSYAWATTRDWAKFGLLYLHKGNWNGNQIFNESWAKYAATSTKASNNEYGGHFWTNEGSFLPDAPKDMYYADGYHGQRILIIPSMDLVIVRTGLTHKSRTESYDYINELVKDVCDSFNP